MAKFSVKVTTIAVVEAANEKEAEEKALGEVRVGGNETDFMCEIIRRVETIQEAAERGYGGK